MAGFADIVGQEQIITQLKNAIRKGKVSHAYAFDGPAHSGKMLLAEAFAMSLQCQTVQRLLGEEEPEQLRLFALPETTDFGVSEEARRRAQQMEPCLECRSCKQMLGKNQPDVRYVTHEKTVVSVDDVREQVNDDIQLRPYSSKYKIYIIDEAERMNEPAQNALLKTMEEPPAYGVILLLTTNADAFLQTIRSRSVLFRLKPVDAGRIGDFLMRRCQVPDYQAELCAAFAQGNVGQAVLLASSETFRELREYVLQLVRRLGDIPVYDLPKELKPILEEKENAELFMDLLLLLFRDVLLYKAVGKEEGLIFGDQAFIIKQIGQKTSFFGLSQIIDEIETGQRRLRARVNQPLALELLFLKIKENMT